MFCLNGEKIALVTETSCDLSQEQLDRYDIRLVSLRVVCTQGEFRDRTEIDNDTLFDLLKSELPKSSLPLPQDVSDLYQQLKSEGCTKILHISMSSGLSGTYNMVRMVAKDFEDELDIQVVDSRTLSTGLGLLVLEAAEVLERTGSVEEAVRRVALVRETQLGCFVIRTLEFLRKGGRIGLVEGVVGTILQVKPVIFVNSDGVYQTLAKARGYASAMDTMVREVSTRFGQKKIRLSVVHGQAAEEAQKLMNKLKGILNIQESFISSVSPVLAIHTGPGLVGVIAQEL